MALTKVRGAGVDFDGQDVVLDADGDTKIAAGTDDIITVSTAGTERVRVLAGGGLDLSAGNLVLDNGYGIEFTATANSSGSVTHEILDDYEIGTFTPAWSGGYGSAPSYGDQLGTYTKIGRFVQVQIRINVSSGSRGGSALTLANLPFTSRSGNPAGGGYTVYQNNFHSTADFYPRVDQNSTTMRFHEENGTAVNANELDADSYEIEMVMIYET